MDNSRPCSSQFNINHLSRDQREHLMKKDVREEICGYADVNIAIRGRYIAPNDNSSTTESGRLLHLHITGRTKQNLNLAVKKIQSLLQQIPGDRVTDEEVVDTCLEEKITVGIEIFPAIFRMKSKILGENNENVDYIAKETGATISLHGKGSGFPENKTDPLHVVVKYKDVASKKETRQLVVNLIETVQQDFLESYGKYYARPKAPEIIPIKNEVKAKKVSPPKNVSIVTKKIDEGLTSNIEKITLGLSHVPVKFNLKSKIYGLNLSNVKHIEKVSGAVLLVEGVSVDADGDKPNQSESPYILVKYLKPEMKDMARGLILNLIETIHQEYTSLYGAFLEKPRTPEIIPVKSATKFPKPSAPQISPKTPEVGSDTSVCSWKSIRNDSHPANFKTSGRSSPDVGPIPPPPPVISKPISPDFIKIPPNHSTNGASGNGKLLNESKPIKVIHAETNRQKTTFAPQNVKPIPSIVPRVAAINSQPTTTSSAVFIPPNSNFIPPPEMLPTLNEMLPVLNESTQYFKKRSNSLVEICHENKKFCKPPSVDVPSVGPIQSIAVQRDQTPTKVKMPPNRYLVPLQKAQPTLIPVVASASVPARLPNPPPAPAPVPTSTPKMAPTQLLFPPSQKKKKKNRNRSKWPVSQVLDNVNPLVANTVEYQVAVNVKKANLDGDDVLSFLNECAKISGTTMANDCGTVSDDDDKSVILLDSEEEVSDNERKMDAYESSRLDAKTRSIAVQTDEEMRRSTTKCACGRYPRTWTIVRSTGVQTPIKVLPKF